MNFLFVELKLVDLYKYNADYNYHTSSCEDKKYVNISDIKDFTEGQNSYIVRVGDNDIVKLKDKLCIFVISPESANYLKANYAVN